MGYFSSVVVTLACTATIASAQVSLVVEIPGDFVKGAPLWMVVTVTNDGGERVRLNRGKGFFNTVGYVLKLVRPSGEVMAHAQLRLKDYSNALTEFGEPESPKWTILPGQSLRAVLTTETLSGSAPAPPGIYRAHVSVLRSESEALASAQVDLVVRSATEDERTALEAMAPFGPYQFGFGATLAAVVLPASLSEEVGLEFEISRLMTSKLPVAEMDEAGIGSMVPAAFDPEVRAMKVEILIAKGNATAAFKLADETIQRYPAASWMLESTRHGLGILQLGG